MYLLVVIAYSMPFLYSKQTWAGRKRESVLYIFRNGNMRASLGTQRQVSLYEKEQNTNWKGKKVRCKDWWSTPSRWEREKREKNNIQLQRIIQAEAGCWVKVSPGSNSFGCGVHNRKYWITWIGPSLQMCVHLIFLYILSSPCIHMCRLSMCVCVFSLFH